MIHRRGPKTITLLASLAGALSIASGACSRSRSEPPNDENVGTTQQAASIANGLSTNGLTQNGLTANGWTTNGWTTNGWTTNGWTTNGWTTNGWTTNGWTTNGWTTNGWTTNGWTTNGWTTNGFTSLTTDANARQFLHYAFSCAMPSSQSVPLVVNGVDTGEVLQGELGLAPEWWTGACDLKCQRWVSACMLARTNAFGKHVNISLRAPTNYLSAADQARTASLAVTSAEAAQFPIREGSYWGNLFAQTFDAQGVPTPAPQYLGCAGPGSNIPQLTMRFCSSQAEACPIFTGDDTSWFSCVDQNPACQGLDGNGASHDCLDRSNNVYQEVLTVWLEQPVAFCGNNICEPGENSSSCASDCHPGTWAHSGDLMAGSIYESVGSYRANRQLVVAPDDSVLVTDYSVNNINLGGAPLGTATSGQDGFIAHYSPTGQLISARRIPARLIALGMDTSGNMAVAANDYFASLLLYQYAPDGVLNWSRTFSGANTVPEGVVVDAAGEIIVFGGYSGSGAIGGEPLPAPPTGSRYTFVAKYSSAGDSLWSMSLLDDFPAAAVADPDGNVFVATRNIGGPVGPGGVYKIDGQSGGIVWSNPVSDFGPFSAFSGATADDAGNVYVTGNGVGGVFLGKYSSVGTLVQNQVLTSGIGATGLRRDAAGNLLLLALVGNDTSTTPTPPDFGAGPFDTGAYDDSMFAVYSPAGDFLWGKQIPTILRTNMTGFGFTSTGHIVIGGKFDASMLLDGTILVNADPVEIDRPDLFVGEFAPPCEGAACDVTPPVIDDTTVGTITAQAVDATGATVWFLSPLATDTANTGTNLACSPPAGSKFPVGTTIVTCSAYDPHGNVSATTFPVNVIDTTPPTMSNIPFTDTVYPATGPLTPVNYTLPTAIDQIDGNVPVTCVPAPGTGFHTGATLVTCTATDSQGNSTGATFNVNVGDPNPPVITLGVPPLVSIPAVSSLGSPFSFAPTAFDQVDGTVPVTCAPVSGSIFPLGTTGVNCSATDSSFNTAQAGFSVQVQYAWNGFMPPINNEGTSIFTLRSTVPVKFSLAPGITNAVATLDLAKLTNGILGSEIEADSTDPADTGNTFHFTEGHYVFLLATKGLSKGTWQLRVDLGDGTFHTVNFSLK